MQAQNQAIQGGLYHQQTLQQDDQQHQQALEQKVAQPPITGAI
jgi:hypothetical protein